MTNEGPPPAQSGSEPVTTEALAGVAREVESLRRTVESLRRLPTRVEQLAALITQSAEAGTGRKGGDAASSWLTFPTDPSRAKALLDDLAGWVEVVFLSYRDGAAALPECWLWHADVVEELLWLKAVWHAAYDADEAPAWVAGDWHDRYRPGVVRRLASSVGRCSLENHPPRDPDLAAQAVRAARFAVGPLAEWWGAHRNEPAPRPSAINGLCHGSFWRQP